MIRLVCVGIAGLCLAGCDKPPAARQVLAQCLADPQAKLASGGTDAGVLQTCMQGKGFVFDPELAEQCRNNETPQSDVACYQSQAWMSDRIKQLGANSEGS